MKKITLFTILFAFIMSTGQALSATKPGVAATVDGEEIPEQRLQNSIDAFVKSQGKDMSAKSDPNRLKSIRNEILDVLIDQELLWQAASKENIIVGDEELDRAFAQYQQQFKDEISFDNKLKEGGYNKTSFRETLKQKLSAQMWIQKFVLPEVAVSQEEIHEFYLQNKQQLVEPGQVRARHILIKANPDASEEEKNNAKAILTELIKQINDGADFAELAKLKSQGPSASRGGDLGFFGPGKMVKPFEAAAFSLKKGEISDIVQTRFGFHIIKCEDIKPGKPYEENEIAEKIDDLIWQQKSQFAVEDAINKLRKQASIEKKDF